jgi:hypothetical protein
VAPVSAGPGLAVENRKNELTASGGSRIIMHVSA